VTARVGGIAPMLDYMLAQRRRHPSVHWGLLFGAGIFGVTALHSLLIALAWALKDHIPLLTSLLGLLAWLLSWAVWSFMCLAGTLPTFQSGRLRSGLLAGFLSGVLGGLLTGGMYFAILTLGPAGWRVLTYTGTDHPAPITPASILFALAVAAYATLGVLGGGLGGAMARKIKQRYTLNQAAIAT